MKKKRSVPFIFYYREGDISVVKERAFHLFFLLSCLLFVTKMHILSHKDGEIHLYIVSLPSALPGRTA